MFSPFLVSLAHVRLLGRLNLHERVNRMTWFGCNLHHWKEQVISSVVIACEVNCKHMENTIKELQTPYHIEDSLLCNVDAIHSMSSI